MQESSTMEERIIAQTEIFTEDFTKNLKLIESNPMPPIQSFESANLVSVAKNSFEIIEEIKKTDLITEKDIEYCDAIKAAWEGRRAKAKKSAKKFKTKSITQKIGGDVAGAVVKAIKHVEHEDKTKIQKNPNAYVTKFEKLDTYANKFVSAFRDILGEDYKSTQMKKEMDDIEKAIKAFVIKFKKHAKK